MIYNTVKTAAAGGNMADDDLAAIAGGTLACHSIHNPEYDDLHKDKC